MLMSRPQILILVTLLFIGSVANMDKSMIGLAVTLPGGWLVDRFGYRGFVLISLAVLAVGSLLFGAVSGLAALAIVRLVVGFGQAGYTNGAPKIISDNFAKKVRGGVQSEVVATAGVGGVLAYTLGAYFMALNWRFSYFALAILYLVALALMFFLVPEHQLTPEEQAAKVAQPPVKLSDAWKNWNTVVLAVALLFNNLVGVALINWLPSVLSANLHVSPGGELNLIMIGNSIVMAIATAFAGTLVSTRLVGKEKVFMLVCSVLSAVLLIVFITSQSLALTVILLYLITVLTMFAFSGILTLPYRLVEPRIIGSAFAVINIGAFVGGILQGQIVGQLATMAGGSFLPAFVFLAAAITLAGIVPYLLREARPAAVAAPHPDRLAHHPVQGHLASHFSLPPRPKDGTHNGAAVVQRIDPTRSPR
jgi:MFS family permease